MTFSSWICMDNSKTMLLRLVHPGGHVELHERPVTAAEIMSRNPRCCVAYPYVFQQPWAVVAPDTVLMLGQKYYVVPMSTIRKLQRLSPIRSPSPGREITYSYSFEEMRNVQFSKEEADDGVSYTCCAFRNKRIAKKSNNYKQHSKNKSEKSGIRLKEETRTSSSSTDIQDSNKPTRKRIQDKTGNGLRGSPKKLWSADYWQPSLESITEE